MNSSLRHTLIAAVMFLIPAAVSAQLYGDKYPSFYPADSVPHFEHILPFPPDTASVGFFNDYVQYQNGKQLRNTPRGKQAALDADMHDFENMLRQFADAFGMEITKAATPEMYNLLFWIKNDATNATYRIKKMSYRKRPYVQFQESTLVPEEEASHYKSSSYPSNHSSAGWGVALVLMQLNPANRDAILQRGYEFGQSRVIAGYHYQSDVDAARLCASTAVLLAQQQPFFQKQFAKAQREYQKFLSSKK